MLFTSSLEPGTLDVLNKIMSIGSLQDFALAGGTNLTLRFGHRLSIDLDFFSPDDFNNEILAGVLKENFENIEIGDVGNRIGLFCYINDIKVDFVKHHHFQLLDSIEEIQGIRLFSLKDIAAMKIFAVIKRPKKKDHWDIAEMLKHFSLEYMIDNYLKKYPGKPLLITIPKVLTYTADIEDDIDPVSLNGATWPDIKMQIAKKVEEYLR